MKYYIGLDYLTIIIKRKDIEKYYYDEEIKAEIVGELDFVRKIKNLFPGEDFKKNSHINVVYNSKIKILSGKNNFQIDLTGLYFLNHGEKLIIDYLNNDKREFHFSRVDSCLTIQTDAKAIISHFFKGNLELKETKSTTYSVSSFYNSKTKYISSLCFYNSRFTFVAYDKQLQLNDMCSEEYQQAFLKKYDFDYSLKQITRIEFRIKGKDQLKTINPNEILKSVAPLNKKIAEKLNIEKSIKDKSSREKIKELYDV